MKLEVGKYYKDRGGRIVMIVKYEEDKVYPYSDNEGETYQENGRYCKTLSKALHDLIEEIKETKMKLEVGKYYKNREGEVVKIVKYEEDEDFYRSVTQCTYTPRGSYFSIGTSPYDLIEEVVPAIAYRVKVEQTDKRDFIKSMEGEKGKVYTEFRILPESCEKFIDMGGWSYYATQVDSGYIDPITGEFVMNEKENKKLKLEVGKTYKTRGGKTVKIVSDDGWDQYKFRDSNKGTYTEEGLRYDWAPEHEHNLVEGVEVETTQTKKEQPMTTKYYRTTKKNTETDFLVGTIVTLFKDDGTRQPAYKDANSNLIQYLVTDRLEEINVKTVKTVISPASKLVKILEDSGYVVGYDGSWRKDGAKTFNCKMFYLCGQETSGGWIWEPEWLEEKVVFDSTVNTFNARQFIVDFMKKKRELSHEAYLYQRDIDEIENEWSDDECEKVAEEILARGGLGFGSSSCPFCVKFAGFCDDCSYGKRHGVCNKETSDFDKYIRPTTCGKYGSELLDFVNNYPGARK